MGPSEISKKLIKGLEQADYERIEAPALGIFNAITPGYRLPYYWDLDPAGREESNRKIKPLAERVAGAIRPLLSGMKGPRVVELPGSNHYPLITDEALVVRE